MMRGWAWFAAFLLLLSTIASLWHKPALSRLVLIKPAVDWDLTDQQWQFSIASSFKTRMLHAASMVELPNGELRAFWFAGSREGAKDVTINTAVFNPQTEQWSDEQTAISRAWLSAQSGRYIRKLGNAVPVLDDSGRLRLFVVTVTFGGWAASHIVVIESDDLGKTWRFVKELKTSPLLNISNLVKTPALKYQDGTIGLPIYHEFLGKFAEILRIDPDNQIVKRERIGYGRKVLQPLILPLSEQYLYSFMRPAKKGFVVQSHSHDGGHSWSTLQNSTLENPGSAVGGLALSAQHLLLANNCNAVTRDELCIKESLDGGKTWQTRWQIENQIAKRGQSIDLVSFMESVSEDFLQHNPQFSHELIVNNIRDKACKNGQDCEFRYDYPYMIQARNGDIHMLYTWNKVLVRHAWLRVNNKERQDGL